MDEAIARYDSGDLCNTCGKWNDVAWKAARTLSALMHGTHKDLVVVPIDQIAEMLWKIDYPKGGSIVKTWEDNSFQDKELYRRDARELIAVARKDGV